MAFCPRVIGGIFYARIFGPVVQAGILLAADFGSIPEMNRNDAEKYRHDLQFRWVFRKKEAARIALFRQRCLTAFSPILCYPVEKGREVEEMALPWRQQAKQPQEFRRIPLRQIRKNPRQPRRVFDAQALQTLADSIRQYGIITPLTVREVEEGYELISGERRLRAAAMAGLAVVPCYIVEVSDRESALMALLENLQRQDLDCFEEALFLRRLCAEFHLTQQEAAQRIGKTQSAVANKLRLLKLSPQTVELVRRYELTERHARALLQLEEEPRRQEAARRMGQKHMTVAQAEAYVRRLLEEHPRPRRQGLLRDVRLFCNTVERAVGLLRECGMDPRLEQTREGETLVVTIRIPDGAK